MSGSASGLPSRGWRVALILALSFLAYAPCINNGFISDDYVVLERSREFLSEPFRLVASPPEGFRATTYASFAVLRLLFGYHAEFFYIFAIALHALNALLLGRLVVELTEREDLALLAAALVAVIQNPQESVMWPSAINESLLGIFVLACLMCWARKRCLLASLCCVFAWLSKESAIIIVPLVAALDFFALGLKPLRKYLYLVAPSALFVAAVALGLSSNPLFTEGFYELGWRSVLVELNSLHRLLFPSAYVFALIVVVARGVAFPARAVGFMMLLMAIALTPYAFLTYQGHIPSRQLHVASMALAVALAYLLIALASRKKLAGALTLALVLANVAYIWFVKDEQFQERARPTNELVSALRAASPRRIAVVNFPGNPWIAKLTTRLAPGWTPELLSVPGADPPCPGCEKWVWSDAKGIVRPSGASPN